MHRAATMKLRWGLAISCVVGIVIVAWQPWRPTDGPPAAATVNGAEGSMRAIAALAADRSSFEQFKDALVEQAVLDVLIRQEAVRRQITLSEAEERELDG